MTGVSVANGKRPGCPSGDIRVATVGHDESAQYPSKSPVKSRSNSFATACLTALMVWSSTSVASLDPSRAPVASYPALPRALCVPWRPSASSKRFGPLLCWSSSNRPRARRSPSPWRPASDFLVKKHGLELKGVLRLLCAPRKFLWRPTLLNSGCTWSSRPRFLWRSWSRSLEAFWTWSRKALAQASHSACGYSAANVVFHSLTPTSAPRLHEAAPLHTPPTTTERS